MLGRHRFWAWLAILTLLGFAVRAVDGVAFAPPLSGDAGVYAALGQLLANGDGYVSLPSALANQPEPTAQHPPLFPMFLALWSLVGVDGVDGLRLACCTLGAATVVLIALLARRLADDRARRCSPPALQRSILHFSSLTAASYPRRSTSHFSCSFS